MTTRMAEPNEGADYLMELNAEQRSAATAIGNGGLGRKMRFDDLPNVRQWQSNRITVTLREKEVLQMDRGADSAIAKAGLGLTMLEAKATLAAVQQEVVAAQAKQIVMQSQVCPDCGAVRMEKDSRRVVYQPSLREAKQKCHSTKVKVSISLRFTTCRGQLHCPAYGSLSTGLSRPRLDETDVEEE